MFKLKKQIRLSYLYLLKWIVLSVVAGIIGSVLVHFFIKFSTTVLGAISSSKLPLFVIPLIGALVAGGIIYRLQPHAAGEGIPSYIRGIRIHKGDLLFSVTFYKFFAALVTVATLGNGGIVGPLGRVSAGIMAAITGRLKKWHVAFTREDQHTAAICGLAAAVGTIFHSSIGGGIFAVEIIQRTRMGYKDLFPAILSSSTAVFVCKSIGWPSFYRFSAVDEFMDIAMIGWLLLLCICTGVLGGFYSFLYNRTTKIIKRKEGNVFLKVIAGSLVAALLAWIINPELMGTSSDIIPALFSPVGDKIELLSGNTSFIPHLGIILLIMFFAKIVCNCITVGSGMSAGFTGPACIAGMFLGASMAQFLGLDITSPTYFSFLAAGFSGFLASSMNIPLAAAIMTTDIFGLQHCFPAALAAVIGFQVTRHETIYDYALAGAGLSIDE